MRGSAQSFRSIPFLLLFFPALSDKEHESRSGVVVDRSNVVTVPWRTEVWRPYRFLSLCPFILSNIDVRACVSHIYKHTHAGEKCRAPSTHRCHTLQQQDPTRPTRANLSTAKRTTTSTSGDPFAVLIRIYWRVFEYS